MPEPSKKISDDVLARISANIFHAAHPAFEPFEAFKWHRTQDGVYDTWKAHSSQALAIDFFGTLKVIDQVSRDVVLGKVALGIGLRPDGPWRIELEWEDPKNLLRETKHKTQVDAIAISPQSMICFEAKFCEKDGGCCSQTTKSKSGIVRCDGDYHVQRNPENKEINRCALSGKGIRYWQVIPEVMFFDETADCSPCPFKGPWYQWMRNIVLAHEVSKAELKSAAVVVIYASHPSLHFPKVVQSANWQSFVSKLRKEPVTFHARTYQDLLSIAVALDVPATQTLIELRSWVLRKIEAVEILTR